MARARNAPYPLSKSMAETEALVICSRLGKGDDNVLCRSQWVISWNKMEPVDCRESNFTMLSCFCVGIVVLISSLNASGQRTINGSPVHKLVSKYDNRASGIYTKGGGNSGRVFALYSLVLVCIFPLDEDLCDC